MTLNWLELCYLPHGVSPDRLATLVLPKHAFFRLSVYEASTGAS